MPSHTEARSIIDTPWCQSRKIYAENTAHLGDAHHRSSSQDSKNWTPKLHR